ncbi:hypothetical protein Pfo_018770 [Paulownia fortunei]|nr:hypothetical protein Pfo_018770 [Paulownia fortunei]
MHLPTVYCTVTPPHFFLPQLYKKGFTDPSPAVTGETDKKESTILGKRERNKIQKMGKHMNSLTLERKYFCPLFFYLIFMFSLFLNSKFLKEKRKKLGAPGCR